MEYLRPVWNCLSIYCSCLRCTDDLGNQTDSGERTYLLADPVPTLRRNDEDNLSNESILVPKKDEQNALCRLVQNTAINMIDVGAIDSHNLEHQEYNDRIKLYSQRLQQQWSTIQHPGKASTGLLRDVPNADANLTNLPLMEDIIQIKTAMSKIQGAVADIKIDHKEAIVVPFRIP